MSSPLEKFILENREKFDTDQPGPGIWEKIAERMDPADAQKKAPVRSLPFKRWLSAAAVLVALGSTLMVYYTQHQTKSPAGIAETKEVKADPSGPQSNSRPLADNPALITPNRPDSSVVSHRVVQNTETADIPEKKEMYYYTKLIELKHEELKSLEKDEPLLYKQFAGDVQKLDSVYHNLENQLPHNSNREQVIEALINNLQLQIGLLNKQLNIIRQIKHSKKSAYEKAYQSV